MQKYETTIVLDSLLKSEDLQTTIKKVETFIVNNGGTVVKNEEWGKKRLAYEINRKQYGNYFHIEFDGPGTLPSLLEREFHLEESVLRHLTLKIDPHILRGREAAQEEAPPVEAEPKPVSLPVNNVELQEDLISEDAADGPDAEEIAPEDTAEEENKSE